MTDPVLHIIAGPNGAGKTTLYLEVIEPVTALEFVNADLIAADRWPNAAHLHAGDAAELAAGARAERIAGRRSFATETVFSHESKLDLLRDAAEAGYRITLHVILVPENLAVLRVRSRVADGGHDVPETKIRERYKRVWEHLRSALALVDEVVVYDNSKASNPLRPVAAYHHGTLVGAADWPAWAPHELTDT